MEVSFLQIQRNYKIRFFKKTFYSYFNEKELEDKNYEDFMKWCYTRQTKYKCNDKNGKFNGVF